MASRQRVIGVYGEATQEITQRAVNGMLRYCEETDGLVLRDFRLFRLIDHTENIAPPYRGKVDGIITSIGIAPREAMGIPEWILSGGVPAVSISHDWFDPRIPACILDARSVASIAADHLIDCNCKSFLFVGYASSRGSHTRADAFKAALGRKHRQVTLHSVTSILQGSFEDEDEIRADKALADKLKKMPKPIGLWALNDNYASAAASLCGYLKLRIPEDVRVMGSDDVAIARSNRPMLTSIRTARDQVGYEAARTLHQLLEKQDVKPVTQVPSTELVVRGSTKGLLVPSGNLGDVMEYIGRHACDGVSVDELVEMVEMSRRNFELSFRKEFGQSPGDAIRNVRLKRAKELLADSQISIAQIAAMVGFKDTGGFSKFFHKSTGSYPTEFRQSKSATA